MKLTAKIALALLLVSLAPLDFFGAIALMLARENLVDQAEAQLRFAAARKRQQIEFLVESYHDRVRLVASRTQLRLSLRALIERGDPAAREQLTRILNDALPTIKGFETLSVTTMNGEVAASTDAGLVGTDWSGEAWFQSGRKAESSIGPQGGIQQLFQRRKPA
jgi:hypothetical protein